MRARNSPRASRDADEKLLSGREHPVPIHRKVKPGQHDYNLREQVVQEIPAPIHLRRGIRANQRRNRLLRYQNAGEDHGGDAGEKTQVEKLGERKPYPPSRARAIRGEQVR
jgi:hypothetical protein